MTAVTSLFGARPKRGRRILALALLVREAAGNHDPLNPRPIREVILEVVDDVAAMLESDLEFDARCECAWHASRPGDAIRLDADWSWNWQPALAASVEFLRKIERDHSVRLIKGVGR